MNFGADLHIFIFDIPRHTGMGVNIVDQRLFRH